MLALVPAQHTHTTCNKCLLLLGWYHIALQSISRRHAHLLLFPIGLHSHHGLSWSFFCKFRNKQFKFCTMSFSSSCSCYLLSVVISFLFLFLILRLPSSAHHNCIYTTHAQLSLPIVLSYTPTYIIFPFYPRRLPCLFSSFVSPQKLI